jgi:hypothetical protein
MSRSSSTRALVRPLTHLARTKAGPVGALALAALVSASSLAAPAGAQCNREAKLTTPDTNDKFGRGLSVGRGFVAVGAPNDSSLSNQEGALFVYSEVAGTWTLEQMIQPAGLDPVDLFGYSVAAGSGLVAASALFDDSAGVDSGAVYVFRKDPGGWVLEQKLTSPFPGDQLNYGRSIAMHGDLLAVVEWSPPALVHVYRRSGTTWSLEDSLSPSFSPMHFGWDVAVDGDLIVVSDPEYGMQAGAVEVYRFSSGTGWASEHVAFGTSTFSRFGQSVDVYRNRFVAGASEDGGTGLAYVQRFDTGTSSWVAEQTLIGADTQSGDELGMDVSLTSSGAYVSAPGQDGVATNAGAVYAFTFGGTQWTQANKIAPTVLSAGNRFGTNIDASNEVLAVANWFQFTVPDMRAVYVFDDCP